MERYLLIESQSGTTSLDVLKLKYPQSIISHRVLEKLYEEDPSPDKKLFHWMVQQNIHSSHKEDVNNLLIALVKDFWTLQDKMKIRDINFYHTPEILQHELNHVKAHLTKEEKKKFKIEDGDVIYEDAKFQVLHPTTLGEICNAGFDTEWCSSNHNLPGKLEDYMAYVVVSKNAKHPDVTSIEDYTTFHKKQEEYYSRRKILVLFSKSFKGEMREADLDDYILMDANNELYECSLAELTSPIIETRIFAHFREHQDDTIQLSLVEQFQNPELHEDDRVELVYMADSTSKKPEVGEKGTVTKVEQTPKGVIYHMKWDGGSTLALIPDEDVWKKIGVLNEASSPQQIEAYLKKKYVGKICYTDKGEVVFKDKFPQESGKPGNGFMYFIIKDLSIKNLKFVGEVLKIKVEPHNMRWDDYDKLFGLVSIHFNTVFNLRLFDGSDDYKSLYESVDKEKIILKFIKQQYEGKIFTDPPPSGDERWGWLKVFDISIDEVGTYIFKCQGQGLITRLKNQLKNDVDTKFNVKIEFQSIPMR